MGEEKIQICGSCKKESECDQASRIKPLELGEGVLALLEDRDEIIEGICDANNFFLNMTVEYAGFFYKVHNPSEFIKIYENFLPDALNFSPEIAKKIPRSLALYMKIHSKNLHPNPRAIVDFVYSCVHKLIPEDFFDDFISKDVYWKIIRICEKYLKQGSAVEVHQNQIVRMYHHSLFGTLGESNVKNEILNFPQDFADFFCQNYEDSGLSMDDQTTMATIIGLLIQAKKGQLA